MTWGLFMDSPENFPESQFSNSNMLVFKANLLTRFLWKKNQEDCEV